MRSDKPSLTGLRLLHLLVAILLPVGITLPAAEARAQTAISIRGVLTDTRGEPIANARVLIEGTTLSATSSPTGTYEIIGVAPGTYTVTVLVLGFLRQSRQVEVPAETTADFELQPDLLKLEETVVVSATSNPESVLESSVAVTTLDRRDIVTRAPRNVADLFKAVPGLWVESSVGQSFNDIFVRGIPTGGQSRFLSIMEDGLPLFPGGDVAFFESDQFLRLDDTVERFEAIRGGPASVLASNAPGGILNLLSRTGGGTVSGSTRFSTSSTALARVDVNVGGPLARNWLFNVGGFVRRDDGAIDPGFTNDSGWQLKGNVTRLFDDGLVRLYVKGMQDRNYVNVGGPYAYEGGGLGVIPGYDLGDDSFGSLDLVDYTFPLADGTSITRSIANGSDVGQLALGAEVTFEIGDGWLLSNLTRYADYDSSVDFDLDFAPPISAVDFGNALLATLGAAIGATGFQYTTVDGQPITDPESINGNGLLAITLPVFSESALQSFTNQLEARRQIGGHALTGGFFFSSFDLSRLIRASSVTKQVTDKPPLFDLTLTGSPLGPLPVTSNGFVSIGNGYQNDRVDGRIYALYATDTFPASDRLRFDLGLRYEWHQVDNLREDTTTFDLDGNPLTIYDAAYTTGTGEFQSLDFNLEDWGASFGVNYLATPEVALFARLSRGFNALIIDRVPGDENMHIIQFETGAKYAAGRFALFGNLFYADVRNVPFTAIQQDTDGNPTVFTNYGSSRTFGLELELDALLSRRWGLRATATLQAPRYTEFGFIDIRQGAVLSFDGNTPARQPKVLVDLTASYNPGPFRTYAAARYYGHRYANDRNTVDLSAYAEMHAGVSWLRGPWIAALAASNLFNTQALTTGNPRFDEEVAVAVPGMLLGGRANLPRTVRISLGYRF